MKRVRILSVSNEVNEKEIIYIHKNSYMDVEKY